MELGALFTRTFSLAAATLAEELLILSDLPSDRRVVLEYLRDAAAQAEWEEAELTSDLATSAIALSGLSDHVRTCPADELLDAALVVTRLADRRALSSPKSVRRIRRAQTIGLCTT